MYSKIHFLKRIRFTGIKQVTLFLLLQSCFTSSLIAAEYPVSSAQDIRVAMRTAEPGDVLIMKSGHWNNAQIEMSGQGTEAQPIILKAEHPGEVVLTGNSNLSVSGSYITINGLLFTDGYVKDEKYIIQLNGDHNRLTNSAIIKYNPPKIDTRYFWVSLNGRDHRVDHNYFSGQNHSGVTTVVWLKDNSPGHHLIDFNYYGQRNKGNDNGFETIRIGTGKYSTVDAHVIVENNLFEEVDGEIEAISNKSNDNIYRHNTFRRTAGTLTLRMGNRCIVDGNFFLGENKKHTGGIRIISEDHTIVNNYFEGTTGRAGGAISISAGTGKYNEKKLTAYPQVRNVVIAYNTFVNNKGPAVALNDGLGKKKRKLLAENVDIINNIFYNDTVNTPLMNGQKNENIHWTNNLVYGAYRDYETTNSITTIDPKFIRDGLLFRPQNKLATQGSPTPKSPEINTDMDGQTRIDNKGIGADQLSNDPIVYYPLTRQDVGPTWEINTN